MDTDRAIDRRTRRVGSDTVRARALADGNGINDRGRRADGGTCPLDGAGEANSGRRGRIGCHWPGIRQRDTTGRVACTRHFVGADIGSRRRTGARRADVRLRAAVAAGFRWRRNKQKKLERFGGERQRAGNGAGVIDAQRQRGLRGDCRNHRTGADARSRNRHADSDTGDAGDGDRWRSAAAAVTGSKRKGSRKVVSCLQQFAF